MTPTIATDGETVTLTASVEIARFLLTEAKRSGQSQVSAYGVTTAWRSHWNGRLAMLDGLLAQLPVESFEEAGLDANGLIPGDKGAVRVAPLCETCSTCEGTGLVEGLDTIGGSATYETCPDCVAPLLVAPTTEDLDDLLA